MKRVIIDTKGNLVCGMNGKHSQYKDTRAHAPCEAAF